MWRASQDGGHAFFMFVALWWEWTFNWFENFAKNRKCTLTTTSSYFPWRGLFGPLWFSYASPRVINRDCRNSVTFGQIRWLTSFDERKSIVLLFSYDSPFAHECSASFRSLFAYFYSLRQNRQISQNFAEYYDFCHFEYFLTFLFAKLFWPGGTSNFQLILVDFHEYTLNTESYHVTEAVNGCSQVR